MTARFQVVSKSLFNARLFVSPLVGLEPYVVASVCFSRPGTGDIELESFVGRTQEEAIARSREWVSEEFDPAVDFVSID